MASKKEAQASNIIGYSREDLVKTLATVAPELESGVTVADELVGTWCKEQTPVVVGEVTHLYSWDVVINDHRGQPTGEVKTVYGLGVKLRAECVVQGDGDVFPAQPGDVIGITLAEKLEALRFQRPGDVVAVQYLGKVDLKGGRTCGRYQARASNPPRETPMT